MNPPLPNKKLQKKVLLEQRELRTYKELQYIDQSISKEIHTVNNGLQNSELKNRKVWKPKETISLKVMHAETKGMIRRNYIVS